MLYVTRFIILFQNSGISLILVILGDGFSSSSIMGLLLLLKTDINKIEKKFFCFAFFPLLFCNIAVTCLFSIFHISRLRNT